MTAPMPLAVPGPAAAPPAPDVTVVIATYNGADRILATAGRLAQQTCADRMSVLIVDDGSTDGTREVCQRAGLRVVSHETNQGVGAARNTGLRHAGTDLIAFTDDDCLLRPDWLEQLLAARERHPDAVAWGGRTVPSGGPGLIAGYVSRIRPWEPLESETLLAESVPVRFLRYLRRSFRPHRRRGERDVASLVTANLLIDRRPVLKAGGFDPRFRYGGEEEELFRRLSRAGGRLVFVPSAVVDHEPVTRLADVLRRSRGYGRGNARLFLKHPDVTPTVYPFPLAVATLAALAAAGAARGTSSWRPLAVLAALAPLGLYPRWVAGAAAERRLRVASYAYVQLLQEGACDLGWADVARSERGQFAGEIRARFPRLGRLM